MRELVVEEKVGNERTNYFFEMESSFVAVGAIFNVSSNNTLSRHTFIFIELQLFLL